MLIMAITASNINIAFTYLLAKFPDLYSLNIYKPQKTNNIRNKGIMAPIVNETSLGFGYCMNNWPLIKNTIIGMKPMIKNKSLNLKCIDFV